MNSMPVISCRNLSKSYHQGGLHVDVFSKLNLTVVPGEMLAIVGASGCGKSTLLQLLGGLDQPNTGDVRINGKSLCSLNERQKGELRNRQLGFIYQFHHLLPEFNALENVCIPLLIRGMLPNVARTLAFDYVTRVGLAHRHKHRIGELSGGERQRIAIARALVTQPRCVLADEPTGNLDEKTAAQIVNLLLELNTQLTTSFVIVTHNRKIARRMDRILALCDGKLCEEKKEAVTENF